MPNPISSQTHPYDVPYYVNGKLNPDLVDTVAHTVAKTLGEKIRSSQIRRFYDDVIRLRQRLRQQASKVGSEEKAFEQLLADWKMLKAKVTYANARDNRTCPKEFKDFLVRHVDRVNTARDFEAFYQHFQAVIAFHKVYARD